MRQVFSNDLIYKHIFKIYTINLDLQIAINLILDEFKKKKFEELVKFIKENAYVEEVEEKIIDVRGYYIKKKIHVWRKKYVKPHWRKIWDKKRGIWKEKKIKGYYKKVKKYEEKIIAVPPHQRKIKRIKVKSLLDENCIYCFQLEMTYFINEMSKDVDYVGQLEGKITEYINWRDLYNNFYYVQKSIYNQMLKLQNSNYPILIRNIIFDGYFLR